MRENGLSAATRMGRPRGLRNHAEIPGSYSFGAEASIA
jgi:hypothetical protein